MTIPSKTLINLETKFWQSMVDQNTAAATWVHLGNRWQCVLHTESPMEATSAKH